MKTQTKFLTKETAEAQRAWQLIDANNQTLGRLTSQIATILRGKNKPTFTPNQDCGDFVVVINSEKIRLTGNKLEAKMYYDHSRFIGGMKSQSAADLLKKNPCQIIERAVRGMLPKGSLGRSMMNKLKLYKGADHPHKAQKPIECKLAYK